MIRIVFIASLALVVCTVLYVPSITPAERFIDAIQAENEAHRSLWGEDTANRVMLRLLDMQQAVKQPHLQEASPAPAPNTPEAAVAQQVGAMGAGQRAAQVRRRKPVARWRDRARFLSAP